MRRLPRCSEAATWRYSTPDTEPILATNLVGEEGPPNWLGQRNESALM